MTSSTNKNVIKASHKDLPLVPETLLKKRHDLEALRAKRKAQVMKRTPTKKVFSRSTKRLVVRKPETFLAKAIQARHHNQRFHRVMKKGMQKRASNKPLIATKIVDEDTKEVAQYQKNSVGAKVVFVVRIRDNIGITKKITRILEKLRLNSNLEGVFLKYTPENRKLLHLIEPWVLYGPPTRATVADLINRRGHGKVKGERVPLTDNTILEKHLYQSKIICVEDLVEEIVGVGKHFPRASTFLWPFRLGAPKTRFETQKLGEKEGKIYGDRGDEINEMLKTML